MASTKEIANSIDASRYTARGEGEVTKQAQGEYQSQLASALKSAQESYDRTNAAKQNEMDVANAAFDSQVAAEQANNNQAAQQLGNYMRSRGLASSAYAGSIADKTAAAGAKALQGIETNRSNVTSGLAAQQALLAQQLSQNQQNANSVYQSNVAARIAALKDQEAQRAFQSDATANSMYMKLFSLQLQEEEMERAHNKALAEKNARSSGSGPSNPKPNADDPAANTTDLTTAADFANQYATKGTGDANKTRGIGKAGLTGRNMKTR